MVKLVFASLFTVAAAGACSAADQTALTDAQTVGEKQDACGKAALSLTGINHDKFTSCVQSDLGISAGCAECYYTVADYGFKNCKAACLLGWCKSGCLSCTQPAQDALSGCTGFSPSTADPCLESPEEPTTVTTTTVDKLKPQLIGILEGLLDDKGEISTCEVDGFSTVLMLLAAVEDLKEKKVLDFFTDLGVGLGKIEPAFKDCSVVVGMVKHLLTEVKAVTPAKALSNFEKHHSDIIEAIAAWSEAQEAADYETMGKQLGIMLRKVLEDDGVTVAVAGACSADDQGALADAQTVGEKQDACGKAALSLTGINHDKFTSCVQSDLGISAGCAECYYTVADYGFKNCKAACLLGWCKSGCLSCTQPAQDALSGCTGFSPSTADPCLESPEEPTTVTTTVNKLKPQLIGILEGLLDDNGEISTCEVDGFSTVLMLLAAVEDLKEKKVLDFFTDLGVGLGKIEPAFKDCSVVGGMVKHLLTEVKAVTPAKALSNFEKHHSDIIEAIAAWSEAQEAADYETMGKQLGIMLRKILEDDGVMV